MAVTMEIVVPDFIQKDLERSEHLWHVKWVIVWIQRTLRVNKEATVTQSRTNQSATYITQGICNLNKNDVQLLCTGKLFLC